MIAKNFKAEIRASMGRQYFKRYKALMHVANETEEELAKATELKKASSQYKKSAPAMNQVWTYQDLGLRFPQEQGSSQNQSKPRTKDRAFTRLPGSLSKVLTALQNKGVLQLLARRPPPNPLPRGWNPNEHCAFHQGPGHPTDNCFALKYAIQDLINQGKISAPEAPNIANNPLPNHGAGVHALFLNEGGKDPLIRSIPSSPSRERMRSTGPFK